MLSSDPPGTLLIVTFGRGEQDAGPTAAAAFTRPYVQSEPVPTIGSAVWNRRVTIDWLVAPYGVDMSNAATAATCGVAGDVPLTVLYLPSFVVVRMLTPGAVSGTFAP